MAQGKSHVQLDRNILHTWYCETQYNDWQYQDQYQKRERKGEDDNHERSSESSVDISYYETTEDDRS